jgi:soluble lytic murein transglycosylase-like protein
MRKRLQLKWMLTASTLLATSFTLNHAAYAEWDTTSRGIATTEEHGRTIYLNADAPAKGRPAAPQAMPSAKTESGWAAAEVSEFYARHPVPSANAKILQANSHGRQSTPEEIDQSIVMAAARHNVDSNLVRAVIKVEWNWNSNAITREGTMGLMPLMPKTALELNGKNPFDRERNSDVGVRNLNYLLEQYNGDVDLTLAAYNAGEAAMRRSAGVPHTAETHWLRSRACSTR